MLNKSSAYATIWNLLNNVFNHNAQVKFEFGYFMIPELCLLIMT